ncbi:hypothetical protein ES703_102832 [subsurface metagenome]
MANPEHVEIVEAGMEAVENWWKQIGHTEKPHLRCPPENCRLDLAGADLAHKSLSRMCLNHADMRHANLTMGMLRGAYLIGADLRGAGLIQADLQDSYLMGSNLDRANLNNCSLLGAFLDNASLKKTLLSGAKLLCADLKGACLRGADLTLAQCAAANFSSANLSGIMLGHTGTDGWKIHNVRCTHFFVFGKRVPKVGCLKEGEFEDRFKSRPTIEFIFEYGMGALDPAVLDAAIDYANSEHPEVGLRLLSIDGRGGLPRAIIEIAEKVSKKDALALVEACYQQKIRQMRKEIKGLTKDKESLLEIASRKVLLPALGCTDSFMGAADLAKHYQVEPEALRKRLDRLREKYPLDADLFIESQDRGTRRPKYVYKVKKVAPHIIDLKKKQSSTKRPVKKK